MCCRWNSYQLGWLRVCNARTRWFSSEEMADIRTACTLDTWDYVEFLLMTGLRVGEMLVLRWEDVQPDSVFVAPAKTDRARWVPLNGVARDVLRRRKHLDRPFELSCRALYQRFRLVLQRARVRGGSPHVLRHSFASRLVQRGATLYRVKLLLGHSSLSMTERYSHLAMTDLAETVRLAEE